jgi:hypothetical protein
VSVKRCKNKLNRLQPGERSVIGVAWYRREQWNRLREISSDRDKLEESYDEWLRNAVNALENLRAAGIDPAKVDVDTEELLEWCRSKGQPVNGRSRSIFAAKRIRHPDKGRAK